MYGWQFQLRCRLWSRQSPLEVVSWLQTELSLDEDDQDAVLSVLTCDPLLSLVPLEQHYQSRFLKRLISASESDKNAALSEAIVSMYADSLQPSTDMVSFISSVQKMLQHHNESDN